MARLLLIFSIFILCFEGKSQEIIFNRAYNVASGESNGKVISSSHGYIVASGSPFDLEYRTILITTDSFGVIEKDTSFIVAGIGSSVGRGRSLELVNNRLYIGGWFSDSNISHPFHLCLDSNFEVIWKDTSMQESIIHSIDVTDSLIASTGQIIISNDYQFLLTVRDLNGNLIFENNYGQSTSAEVAYSIDHTADNGYVISGYRYHDGGDSNPLIIKTDSLGNLSWEKEFELSSFTEGAGISLVSSDQSIYIAQHKGYFQDAALYSKVWVAKLNPQGEILWEKEYGDTIAKNSISSIVERDNGTILITGSSTYKDIENPEGKRRGLALNIDTAGNEIYTQFFVNKPWNFYEFQADNNFVNSTVTTKDGGYIAAGYLLGVVPQDLWVVKFDSNGCYDVTWGGCASGVGLEKLNTDDDWIFYPNPATDYINVGYLGSNSTSIRIYNMQGALVKEEQLVAIEKVDLSELSDGLYLVSLTNNQTENTETFRLVKQ